jgi:hypothetical protein
MNESSLISNGAFARWKVYNRKATPTDKDRLFGFLGWFASERVETKGRLRSKGKAV